MSTTLMRHLPVISVRTEASCGAPEPTLDALLAQAREEGEKRGDALARQACEAQMEALRQSLEDGFELERADWNEKRHDQLRAMVDDGLVAMYRALSAKLAELATPVLLSAERDRDLSAFIATVRSVVEENEALHLTLSGYGADVAAVAAAFGDRGVSTSAEPAGAAYVEARIGQSAARVDLDALPDLIAAMSHEK
ncbi:MAG: hypothetical protein KGM42_02320 [Hyphomicrobiales bacterium]|nr:hypothetical protein [Hyphomicrobiales bacterium]